MAIIAATYETFAMFEAGPVTFKVGDRVRLLRPATDAPLNEHAEPPRVGDTGTVVLLGVHGPTIRCDALDEIGIDNCPWTIVKPDEAALLTAEEVANEAWQQRQLFLLAVAATGFKVGDCVRLVASPYLDRGDADISGARVGDVGIVTKFEIELGKVVLAVEWGKDRDGESNWNYYLPEDVVLLTEQEAARETEAAAWLRRQLTTLRGGA